MNALEQYISNHVLQWVFDFSTALFILAGFFLFFRLTRQPLKNLLQREHVDEYLVLIIVDSIYRTFIILISIITALAQLGINVFAALTGFGIAGIAVGFAAKDTLGNIISGFSILWDKPFRVGDWVEADGHFGQVQAITLRTTRIHKNDNTHVIIPNQSIVNSTVLNHHNNNPVRRKTHIQIPLGSDVEYAKTVLKEKIQTLEKIHPDKEVTIGISEISHGLITLVILTWCKDVSDSIGFSSSVRNLATHALQQAGFTNPYPVALAEKPRLKKVKK